VVAHQGLCDVVMIEKFERVASILAGDLIGFFEDADGAKGNVFEVANGRSDEVEAAGGFGGRGLDEGFGVHEQESSMRRRSAGSGMV
jgi:hypothetical protein